MPQSPTGHVFISYSRRDDEVMHRIVKHLRGQGVKAWVDNEKLIPGTPVWEEEIEKAIHSASAVIVVLSPDSKKSVWVRREISLAERYAKRIFPIMVAGDEDTSISLRLTTNQYVDIRENEAVGLNALSTAISFYLEKLVHLEDESKATEQDNSTEKLAQQEVKEVRASGKKGGRRRTQSTIRQRPFLKWVIIAIIGSGILVTGGWGVSYLVNRISSIPTQSTESISNEFPNTETVGPLPDESTSTEPVLPAIGTPEHPIKIFFVPSYFDTQVVMNDGNVMANALNQSTGLIFEVIVPASYSSTIEEMCATPFDSIGFIPAYGYVLANQLCDIDASFTTIRFGLPGYWTEILIRRDSNINSLSDLNGLTWGFPDKSSISGYLIPFAMFADYRIFPSEEIPLGGHTTSVMAVYNGDVDFVTTYYIPPLTTEGEYARTFDEYITGAGSLDIWDDPATIYPICENSNNKLLCNNWRVMDARASISEEFPDVIRKIRVLEISPFVPNEAVAFGAGFPLDLRVQIEEALNNYSQTDSWNNTFGSQDSYAWQGLYPITDTAYDLVRKMVEVTGLTIDSLNE